MANKVYSGSWHSTLAVNGWETINFNVQSVGRQMRIKSLTFNLAIYEIGLTAKYNWRDIKSQTLLTIANTTDRICYSYTSPSVVPAFMGSFIEIYEPGQLFFDGFYVANNLPMQLFIFNNEIDAREFWSTIIIETEEKTIFL